MDKISIYSYTGLEVVTVPSNDAQVTSAEMRSTFMSNDTLEIKISSRLNLGFKVGDWCVIDNCKYRMNQTPQMAKNGAYRGYEYALTFESVKYDLANVRFLLPDETVADTMTADLPTLVAQVVTNANRVYGAGSWIVGRVPMTDVITESFTDLNCLAALQSMMTAFEDLNDTTYEFRVTTANGINIIDVFEEDGGDNSALNLQYGHSGGLYGITRQSISSENIVTRLYAYGSSENIPTGYRHTRLCMRNKSRNESFIENATTAAVYGIKEGFVTYDDIKPRARFKVSAVARVARSGYTPDYYVRLTCDDLVATEDYGFYIEANWEDNVDDYAEWCEMFGYNQTAETYAYYQEHTIGNKKYTEDGEVSVTFNTGNCAGLTFHVLEGSSDLNGNITLVTQIVNEDEPTEYYQPSDPNGSEAWKIAVGDEFVISNILLPTALVHKAENELVEKANEELEYLQTTNARYQVEFDNIAKDSLDTSDLLPGNFVKVTDAELGISGFIKIQSITRDIVNDTLSMDITSIKKSKSLVGRVDRVRDSTLAMNVDGASPTSLTSQFRPNYDDGSGIACNNLYVSAGVFIDASLAGHRRTWHVGERVLTMDRTNESYDVYIQASKKSDAAAVILLRNRTREVYAIRDMLTSGSDAPFANITNSSVLAARNDGCYYMMIGTISAARAKVNTSLEDPPYYRTLTLEYGCTTTASGDIDVMDADGNITGIDVGERIAKDYSNVKVSNANIAEISHTLRGLIETLQTGTAGGVDVKFVWSKCDDQQCKVVDNPDDLMPELNDIK